MICNFFRSSKHRLEGLREEKEEKMGKIKKEGKKAEGRREGKEREIESGRASKS